MGWSLSYILGDIKVPTKDEMVEDVRKWTDREKNCKSVLDIIDLQNDYICGLHNETGHTFKKFYDYRDLLKKWIDDKFNKDLYTFRNQSLKASLLELNPP